MQQYKTLFTLLSYLISLQTINSAKYKQFLGLNKLLLTFTIKDIKLSEISYLFIKDFEKFINNKSLSQNTKFVYWNRFKELLSEAYKLDYLKQDFTKIMSNQKMDDVIKSPLTDDDIKVLFDYTPPIEKNHADMLDKIKDMALFSLYTGMRFSDIQQLNFIDNIKYIDGNYIVQFKQEKTNKINKLMLHNNLQSLLLKYADIEQPFNDINYHTMQYTFKKWVSVLGRKVSFHDFRHTFANKLNKNKVDILTISSLLGHSNLNTTQKYLHSLDSHKSEAVLSINY